MSITPEKRSPLVLETPGADATGSRFPGDPE
jgi:hypothetical protein